MTDVNIHVKAKETEQTKRKVRETRDEVGRAGRGVQEAGNQAERSGRKWSGFGNIISSVKSHLLGLATFSAIFGFLQRLERHATRAADALGRLVDDTRQLIDAGKALASQTGTASTAGGQLLAIRHIQQIQRQGNLPDFSLAKSISTAAASTFGAVGRPLSTQEVEIAGNLAGFIQREDITEDAVGPFFKILSASGARTPEEYYKRTLQLRRVQQPSNIGEFSPFVRAAVDPIIAGLTQGATFEEALSFFGASLDVRKSGELAAQAFQEAAVLLQRPELIQALSREQGISSRQFRELPFGQRFSALESFFTREAATGAGQERLQRLGVTGEQFFKLSPVFTTQQFERRRQFAGIAHESTADQFRAEAVAFQRTPIGQLEAQEASRVALEASATLTESAGEAFLREAEAEFAADEARGDVPLFHRKVAEVETRVARRLNRLIGEARNRGQISAQVADELLQEVTEQRERGRYGLVFQDGQVGIGGADRFTAGEIGGILDRIGPGRTVIDNSVNTYITPAVAPDGAGPIDPTGE